MFNENLRELRKSKGFTQEELATKINVVRQTVSKWEKGLSVPDADSLQKIADVLDVEVSQLLGAKIEKEEDIGTYYMHGVSHHLGLDTHDCVDPRQLELKP